MALFGDKKPDQSELIAQNMQNLSEQIAALKQQLNEKNQQITQMQGGSQDQAQVDDLHRQMTALQQQLASAQAEKSADAQASQLMLQNAQQQIAALKAQIAGMQTGAPQVQPPVAQAPGGLQAGGTAYVTRAGGMALRLRDGAGLSADVVGSLQPGTRMTLLDGPRQNDNHAWWHIRTDDGREGWVAGEELRTQPD